MTRELSLRPFFTGSPGVAASKNSTSESPARSDGDEIPCSCANRSSRILLRNSAAFLDDEAAATQALQDGAQDYLIKGQLDTYGSTRGLLHALRCAVYSPRPAAEA